MRSDGMKVNLPIAAPSMHSPGKERRDRRKISTSSGTKLSSAKSTGARLIARWNPKRFGRLLQQAQEYANACELFVLDAIACADPKHRLPLRVIAEQAWHAHFSRCLFLRPTFTEQASFDPEWLVLAVPGCVSTQEKRA